MRVAHVVGDMRCAKKKGRRLAWSCVCGQRAACPGREERVRTVKDDDPPHTHPRSSPILFPPFPPLPSPTMHLTHPTYSLPIPNPFTDPSPHAPETRSSPILLPPNPTPTRPLTHPTSSFLPTPRPYHRSLSEYLRSVLGLRLACPELRDFLYPAPTAADDDEDESDVVSQSGGEWLDEFDVW